ncbi:MAG: class IV adenylate cyclase [Anaerolineales bacterium]
MARNSQELEVKFWVKDLAAVRARLQNLGAHLHSERVHETNLRFDTPEYNLQNNLQVLRLRRDQRIRLTYKGPSSNEGGARLRTEIEIEVNDFDQTQNLLHALGYRVSSTYEKYRSTYQLREIEIVLDELPYGDFVELEGTHPEDLHALSAQLGLAWESRLQSSYLALFDSLRPLLGISSHNLSFETFAGIHNPLAPLQLTPADDPAP